MHTTAIWGARRIHTIIFAVALAAGCGFVPPPRPPIIPRGDFTTLGQQVDWQVQNAMDQREARAFAVSVVDSNGRLWARQYGEAHDGEGTDPHSVFRVGSVSKVFTAIAVMQLVEQGELDLDAPLTDQLPGFSVKSRFQDMAPITPRLLLTHHAGLAPDPFHRLIGHDPIDFRDYVAIASNDWLASPPGEIHSYSNVGYALLGSLVEAASGERFEDYVANHILAPLEMNDTSFESNGPLRARLADGYRGGEKLDEGTVSPGPAGSLMTSPHDMERFAQALLRALKAEDDAQGHILTPRLLKSMLVPQNEDVLYDEEFRIGLCFWLEEVGGRQVARHPGDTVTFHAEFMLMPSADLAVISMTNTAEASGDTRTIARSAMLLALETRTGEKPSLLPELPPPPMPLAPPLDGYEGEYATILGVGHLEKQLNGFVLELADMTVQLVPDAGGGYLLNAPLGNLLPFFLPGYRIFPVERNGNQALVIHLNGMLQNFAHRFEPAPIPDAWRARIGSYALDNAQDSLAVKEMTISEKHGVLRIDALMFDGKTLGVALRPLDDNTAVSEGRGRFLGGTVTASGDVVRFMGYDALKR